MSNVIQFVPTRPQPTIQDHEDGTNYTREDLEAFDYRGTWSLLVKSKYAELGSLMVTRVRPLQLAQGAMIALYLKGDHEAATELSLLFERVIKNKEPTVQMLQLPEFTRGYVWSYNMYLLCRARVEVEHFVFNPPA